MPKPALQVIETDEEKGFGQPLLVKLSRIQRYEGQPRRTFNQKGLEELADDIQENEQETPVRVCKHSSQSGVFVLIGGERRWRAFGIIRDRTNTDPLVKCLIDTVHDERHHFRAAFRDNIQREDLVPLDEAAAYKRLYDESRAQSHSAKIAEVAKIAKKSVTHIENYIYMDSLPSSVKTLMDPERDKEVRLTTTAAVDIARSTTNPTLQFTIAKESIERSLTIVETRALISVKTGKTGYGVGGRMRRPSDDYKALRIFLSGTLNRARRVHKGLDIDALYTTRDQEIYERRRDAEVLEELVDIFGKMLKATKGK